MSETGRIGTGVEVLNGVYQTVTAPAGKHLGVGIEQAGDIVFGYGGRITGAGLAEAGLLALGTALEFVPGPGTVLGTTIIGGAVGGVGAVELFEGAEKLAIKTYQHYNNP